MKCQLILALVSSVIGSKCAKPALRREIREISRNEVQELTDTINALHNEEDKAGISTLEKFTKIHSDNVKSLFFTPTFLPWHRVFLRNFERELQRINPKVVLPYWDWSLDAQAPRNSSVLTPGLFGSSGDSSKDYCVVDGPFANWRMKYPSPHCLRRSFDEEQKPLELTPPKSFAAALAETKFSAFSKNVEFMQSNAHFVFGGSDSDFETSYSPNDPMFYLQYTFIDMLWANWQRKHPNATQYEGEVLGKQASLSDQLIPFSETAGQVLDTEDTKLCYSYPEYPSSSMRLRH
ncbi:hypothetical protein DSO57_1038687 [Entomophthora muscae]|uniref:Uncharacterized protein n=1 Tax=Entomophthora muscae TaxID=34485 RepID=A0ACC2S0P5_9FUNG|nr:hypothetical protein DSO57_1038687 [Entomophthora muscae]